MYSISNSWNEILKDEFEKEYFKNLKDFLEHEYSNYQIFPPKEDIFNALNLTDYNDVVVVIIGQDPYHEIGQAHGLCFSVLSNTKLPPSLKNIYKELESDLNIKLPNNGNLTKWAKQGVLLLNTVLTVREHHANSHKNKGWENFTDAIIKSLNNKKDQVIFLLWGNDARKKSEIITNKNHIILTAPHPSPLSAYQGFFGCKHFSKVNEILIKNKKEPIDWSLS